MSVPLVFPPSSGILSDLFPGVTIPEHDYGVFQSTIEESLVLRNLQQLPCMTKKVGTKRGFSFSLSYSELALLFFYCIIIFMTFLQCKQHHKRSPLATFYCH